MTLGHCKHLAIAATLAVGLAACAEETPYEKEPVPVTAGTAGIANNEVFDWNTYDRDMQSFLGDYNREHEMFADDTLEYEVRQGTVNVTGDLDSQQELTELQTRIRRIPGVRNVNVGNVRVGGA